jgi:Spy/CpxP family protein refolding chaperone
MKVSGKKIGTLLVVVAMVMSFVSLALAGPGGFGRSGFGRGNGGCGAMGPGGGCMGGGFGNCLYSGALSPEQGKEAQSLREGHLKEIAPVKSQLFTKRLELRNLWAQPNPDRDAIMAKQAEINELEKQLQEKNTKFRLDMRALVDNR